MLARNTPTLNPLISCLEGTELRRFAGKNRECAQAALSAKAKGAGCA